MTTHQVEDIHHVLTDVMFMDRGRIVFDSTMEELELRYLEVVVHPEQVAAGRVLKPVYEHQGIGSSVLLFDLRATAANREQVASLGQARTPSITEFVRCYVGKYAGRKPGILAGQVQGVAK